MANVCGWTVDRCGGCGSNCWDSHTDATKERAAALATHFMWAATGRRYGLCEVTVMPCNPRPVEPLYRTYPLSGGPVFDPYVGRLQVARTGVAPDGGCGGGCSCSARCEIALDGPVGGIVEIVVDGDVVPADAYQVHNGHLLVRVDGECWPACQVYDGTPRFLATYLRGLAIPAAVQHAVEALACEYAKACSGSGDCRLPPNIASISRQGVELTVAEVDATKGKLRTGIRAVDDVLDADNPHGLVQAPQVLSPDMPPPARVVTWIGGS